MPVQWYKLVKIHFQFKPKCANRNHYCSNMIIVKIYSFFCKHLKLTSLLTHLLWHSYMYAFLEIFWQLSKRPAVAGAVLQTPLWTYLQHTFISNRKSYGDEFLVKVHLPSPVRFYVPHVMCHMSRFTCHMSCVTYYMSSVFFYLYFLRVCYEQGLTTSSLK